MAPGILPIHFKGDPQLFFQHPAVGCKAINWQHSEAFSLSEGWHPLGGSYC